jgi:hypothetical protein
MSTGSDISALYREFSDALTEVSTTSDGSRRTSMPSGLPAAGNLYGRASTKNLRLEKSRIKYKWRDCCNRYLITARVTVIY